jgi:hypothetical protein
MWPKSDGAHQARDGPVTQAAGPMHDLTPTLANRGGGFTHKEIP